MSARSRSTKKRQLTEIEDEESMPPSKRMRLDDDDSNDTESEDSDLNVDSFMDDDEDNSDEKESQSPNKSGLTGYVIKYDKTSLTGCIQCDDYEKIVDFKQNIAPKGKPQRHLQIATRLVFDAEKRDNGKFYATNIRKFSYSQCNNCGAEGHSWRKCPLAPKNGDKVKCFFCGAIGEHTSRMCPKKVIKKGCFICGDLTHTAAVCDYASDAQKRIKCVKCGKYGHYATVCGYSKFGFIWKKMSIVLEQKKKQQPTELKKKGKKRRNKRSKKKKKMNAK